VQIARYDNGADPYAFANGQWGWETAFTQIAAQVSLPAELGLVAQWLTGETYWLAGARADGTLPPAVELVEDAFDAKYLLLTRVLRGAHRISLRYDTFTMERENGSNVGLDEEGHAWTIAYRYRHSERLSGGVEWLRVTSRRDLWAAFYGAAPSADERQLRLQVSYTLGLPKLR
jgi:hypothetical protein